ncbi:methyltransferase domain-containing protein [Kribbella sp. NPDC051587]|uniref:methyltransferase domain-containing protein n=1 Tax=Kribbella sp. NPDC051587 TaxID=3364119 RepID=UPI0037B8A2B6
MLHGATTSCGSWTRVRRCRRSWWSRGVIAGLLDVRVGMAVLDVGSGTGDDLIGIAALVEEGGRAVGVDVSTAMVAEARRRTAEAGVPAEFVVGDVTRLEFADACFDRVRAERVLMAMADWSRASARAGCALVGSALPRWAIGRRCSRTGRSRPSAFGWRCGPE